MVIWGRVEIELCVRDRRTPVVVGEHLPQVPDAHVVGDHRQVTTSEATLGELEVANGRAERLARVEAIVGAGALALQSRGYAGMPVQERERDLSRQASAAGEIDVHAQQGLARLGEDLGQPGGVRGIGAGDHVRSPRALHEHDPLQHVRVDASACGRGIDCYAERGNPGCCRKRASGALGVQHLRVACGRPLDEIHLSRGYVRERVARARRAADPGQRQRGPTAPAAGERDDHGDHQGGGCRRQRPAPRAEPQTHRRPYERTVSRMRWQAAACAASTWLGKAFQPFAIG